jgi:GTP-binding protein Era
MSEISGDDERERAGAEEAAPVTGTRSGFVGLAGRPNVGKSTLVNALVGRHVAIVSVRPQTTRRAIRGVATDLETEQQLVLVDLPGVQRPRDALTKRMQKRVERELADSDVALLVINGEEGVGPGDRFIAGLLKAARIEIPVICAVNKCDKIARRGTIDALTEAASLPAVDEVFPISAQTGEGLEALLHRLGELIPEQVLNRTRQEIPHSVEVSVLEVSEPREDGLVTVTAEIWAETESQKGILIGRRGAKIGEIGTAARRSLERELECKVHLDLSVRVRRNWRRDEDMLDRLGIE